MKLNVEPTCGPPTNSPFHAEAFPNFGVAALYMLARSWAIQPDWSGDVSRLTGSMEVPQQGRGRWQWTGLDASSPGELHVTWENREGNVEQPPDVLAQLHEFRKRRAQRATEERMANEQGIEAVVRAVIERVRWFRTGGAHEWPVTVTVDLGGIKVRKLDKRIELLDQLLHMWLTRDSEEDEALSSSVAQEQRARADEGLTLELRWDLNGSERHEADSTKYSDRTKLFLRQEALTDEHSVLRVVDGWFLSCVDLDIRTRDRGLSESRDAHEALRKLQAANSPR